MKEKNFTVDLIIPFYEHHYGLNKLLSSLKKLNVNKIKLKVLIINDGSKINKKQIRAKTKHKIIFITNKKNMGQTYSRNAGIRKSKAEFIWLLDSDTEIINENTIQNAITFLNEDIIGVSGTAELLNRKKTYLIPKILGNGFVLYERVNPKKKYINEIYDGTSLFIKRKTFLKIGFFNNKLKVHEEYEWSLRLNKKDRKFIFDPKNFVLHYNFKTKKNDFNQDYFDRIIFTRAKIIKKYNKNKFIFLFFYDLFYFPFIFIKLKILKNFISTRFTSKSGNINLQNLLFILRKLLSSYLC